MNRIKRSISLLMAVIMMVVVLPVAEIKAYGEKISWGGDSQLKYNRDTSHLDEGDFEIGNVIPNPISVDKDGNLNPEVSQLIINSKDNKEVFFLYQYLSEDEGIKVKYPIIELGVNGELGDSDIVINPNDNNNIDLLVYDNSGKLVKGKEGNRLGSKIVISLRNGEKIDKNKIGNTSKLRVTNPMENDQPIMVDGSITNMDKSADFDVKFINFESEPDKVPIISEIRPSVITNEDRKVEIIGKNFLPKEKIKIYLSGEELALDDSNLEINDEGSLIKLTLPEKEEDIYSLLIRNEEGGYANGLIEYVDKFTELDDIEGVTIIEKPMSYGENNKFLISDFLPDNSNLVFRLDTKTTISQEYFNKKISQLRLRRKTDGREVVIKKGKIDPEGRDEVENATFRLIEGRVYIYLDNLARKRLSYGSEFGKCENKATAAGEYEIYLDLVGSESKRMPIKVSTDQADKEKFLFLSIKDKPWVISTRPSQGDSYYNPNNLYKSFVYEDKDKKKIIEEGYYLEVKFNNLGGLRLVKEDGSHSGIRVLVEGDFDNKVDESKRINLQEDRLYIPLKGKLEDGKTYNVEIPENNYVYYPEYITGDLGEDSRNNGYKNKCYRWSFSTKSIPVVDSLFEGSVVENYDTGYPIVLEGIEFSEITEVEFKDSKNNYYRADRVRYRELDDGSKRLYVYLPRGRDRLRVDNYLIIVRNGEDHKLELEYGTFSVIAEGREVPNEEYKLKDDRFYGDVKSLNKDSQDILELRSSDRNRSYLKIDLDDLMGIDTWSRIIEYPVNYRDSIGELVLESKWVDVSIFNVRLASNYDTRDIRLRVGRAAPNIMDSMKAKLIGRTIKSDFIEVQGDNFTFDKLVIDIPYRNSDGDGLELMKYDQITREFVRVPSVVNIIDQSLSGSSRGPGIFVVVE